MAVNSINSVIGATENGTRIVKSGSEMDKNAFLRILTAELSNQNPDNAKDSTQYVAQMAQFSSLEQMTNLNNTMSFMGASTLIGKSIKLNSLDEAGMQYTGIVKGTNKDGSAIILNVEIDKNGQKEIMEFPYENVAQVNS
jgi:flagellar basal-body rod modification protein FlgD